MPSRQREPEKLYDQKDPSHVEECFEAISYLVEIEVLRELGSPTQLEFTDVGCQLSRKLTAVPSE